MEIASLDDVRRLLTRLPGPDERARDRAREREPQLTKPRGALGRLEALAEWLAAWQGRHPPRAANVAAIVFAGNHGVVSRGVSAYPAGVTGQMVANFRAGGAAINQLCQTTGVSLDVVAIDLDRPTEDISIASAMNDTDCVAAMRLGMRAVPREADLLCLGEMGIGNTTAAAALCMTLFGGRSEDWTGPGTGVDGAALSLKRMIVAKASGLHCKSASDGLDMMRRLGGREFAALTGAVLAARIRRIPVLLDGYVSTAAVAHLTALNPDALAHCQAAHLSAEPGHQRLLERIGMRPLLALDMRLGEASGAVLAVAIVKAAAACHGGMATFDDARVSDRLRG